eukprot:2236534-Lingulodinium_polyedra.AAC.1
MPCVHSPSKYFCGTFLTNSRCNPAKPDAGHLQRGGNAPNRARRKGTSNAMQRNATQRNAVQCNAMQ